MKAENDRAKIADDAYQLDLDEHASSDLEEVIEEAVHAVDQASTAVSQEPEDAAGEARAEPLDDRSGSGDERDLRERLMRTLADFDNFRKRTEREKKSLRQFAVFDVMKDFLSVIDNLERAVDSSGSADDLKAGLSMIMRQQREVLRRHGVEKIEAVGEPFDPTLHEAVAREESAEVDVPTVTSELQSGYLLHDRLLRPAMVHVAMPAGGSRQHSGDTERAEA